MDVKALKEKTQELYDKVLWAGTSASNVGAKDMYNGIFKLIEEIEKEPVTFLYSSTHPDEVTIRIGSGPLPNEFIEQVYVQKGSEWTGRSKAEIRHRLQFIDSEQLTTHQKEMLDRVPEVDSGVRDALLELVRTVRKNTLEWVLSPPERFRGTKMASNEKKEGGFNCKKCGSSSFDFDAALNAHCEGCGEVYNAKVSTPKEKCAYAHEDCERMPTLFHAMTGSHWCAKHAKEFSKWAKNAPVSLLMKMSFDSMKASLEEKSKEKEFNCVDCPDCCIDAEGDECKPCVKHQPKKQEEIWTCGKCLQKWIGFNFTCPACYPDLKPKTLFDRPPTVEEIESFGRFATAMERFQKLAEEIVEMRKKEPKRG